MTVNFKKLDGNYKYLDGNYKHKLLSLIILSQTWKGSHPFFSEKVKHKTLDQKFFGRVTDYGVM